MPEKRAWPVLGPVILASVLAGHGLAYRITGTPEGATHDYLGHVPQVLLILILVGLATVRLGARTHLPPAWQLPAAAVATFVVQEHVERLVHDGSFPWLFTTPAFLVGLVLQLPIALVALILTRGALEALAGPVRIRRPAGYQLIVASAMPESRVALPLIGAPLPGRGPPHLVRP